MIFRIFILMEYFVFQNGYETQDNAENFGSSPIHRNFYNKQAYMAYKSRLNIKLKFIE